MEPNERMCVEVDEDVQALHSYSPQSILSLHRPRLCLPAPCKPGAFSWESFISRQYSLALADDGRGKGLFLVGRFRLANRLGFVDFFSQIAEFFLVGSSYQRV